jgi:hypothetical protein
MQASAPNIPSDVVRGLVDSAPIAILLSPTADAYPIPTPNPMNAKMIRRLSNFHFVPFARAMANAATPIIAVSERRFIGYFPTLSTP